MKQNKIQFYTILLLVMMAFAKHGIAIKGPSCDSAKVLTYPISNSVTSYTDNAYWFKVTLDAGNYNIHINNTAGAGKMFKSEVYIGTCATLTLVSTDTLNAVTNTEFDVRIHNTVNATTFYVKLYNLGGSVNFNATTTTTVNIAGQIGFCPGQSVTLVADVLNPNGTQTYTWQPGGSNSSPITFVPTNILTPTTYTLTYNDNGGTLTTTVNIFPLSPAECQNCEQVQNGHFEWYDQFTVQTPPFTIYPITNSQFWVNPNGGSADYFNANFGWTNPTANSGNGYAGIYTYYNGLVIREYIQSQLKCPLVQGQDYLISFFAKLGDECGRASNNIGAHLSTGSIGSPTPPFNQLTNTPQVNHTSVLNFSASWTQISGIVSGNNEDFITIGNFFNSASTTTASSTSPAAVSTSTAAYYFIDDVSVTPLPPSLSSSTSTVMCNCASNITLTATGSPSVYVSWTNGVTTYTGSVVSIPCPTATTIYTCTVDLPCANCAPITSTIQVSVVGNPTITAVASPTSICAGNSTTLTASGGTGTYTWQPGGSTSNPVVVTPSVTTIYTVTGTNTLGCTSTGTVMVTVNSSYCCQKIANNNKFVTGNWTAQTASTTVGAIVISVTGVLTINANVTFNHTIIRMAPNAKIIIGTGQTVNLNSAHLFSCDYMWEGIETTNNSTVNFNRATLSNVNPTLDDANKGIYADATSMTTPAVLSVNYLELSKNHIGVMVENYTGTAAYPFTLKVATVQGDVGTTYSPGSILKTYLPSGGGSINYPSTEYGVLFEDVNAGLVGSTNGGRNTFKNLQNGVRMLRSNAHVLRNDFLNMNTGYNNKSIWAVGDYATVPAVSNPTVGLGTKHRFKVGIGSSNHCTFTNLKYGIYSDSCMTNEIENNTFSDVNGTGIAVYRSNFFRGIVLNSSSPPYIGFSDTDTSYIENNVMAPSGGGSNLMQNGIGFFDNVYLYNYVLNNDINLKPAGGIWSEGIGIYDASSNYYAEHYVLTNTIDGTGNYGIHQVNQVNYNGGAPHKAIASNTIIVGTGSCSGFFNTPNVGVYSVNSPYATIAENIIDETSLGGAPSCMIGVYISNGQADNIGCNLLRNNSINCAVDQNNIASVYRGNVMDLSLAGLYLTNGTMGDLGSSLTDAGQNEWINNTFSTYVASGLGGSDIYYDNSITDRIPTVNGNAFGIPPFGTFLSTVGTLGCTQHHKGGSTNQIQSTNNNDALAEDIINGNVQFSQYNDGLLWEHKNGILNLLKDSLLDNENATFGQFRTQETNTNLGKINTLMRSIGNYADVVQNKNTYLQSLSGITTSTNVVEQNYQTFMYEYINNIAGAESISAGTYANIKQLAQKCPYSDGAVVYNARALMKIWGDDEIYHNACEVMSIPAGNGDQSKLSKTRSTLPTENVLVYPNPNNGTFNIAYTFQENTHTFELYDLMGKKVTEKTLSGNDGVEKINLSNINHGIYFYKVIDVNGKMLFSGKVAISK